MFKVSSLFSLGLVCLLAGCDGKDPKSGKDKTGDKANEAAWAPFSVDAPRLEFDDTAAIPTLDNGRLNIKVLDGWKETNQKRGNLFVFLRGGKSYPALIVQKPEDAGEIKDVDEANKNAYLTEMSGTLPEAHKNNLLDKPKLIDINRYPWVLYRVGMKSGTNEKLEVAYLTTVAKGRKYTLEFRALDKQGNNDWPALLTMAHGISFGGDQPPGELGKEPLEKSAPDKSSTDKSSAEKSEPVKEPAAKEPVEN